MGPGLFTKWAINRIKKQVARILARLDECEGRLLVAAIMEVTGAKDDAGLPDAIRQVENAENRARILFFVQQLGDCSVHLLNSIARFEDLPKTGKNIILIALIDHALHLRIFNDHGKMIADTNTKFLPVAAQQIDLFTKHLEELYRRELPGQKHRDDLINSLLRKMPSPTPQGEPTQSGPTPDESVTPASSGVVWLLGEDKERVAELVASILVHPGFGKRKIDLNIKFIAASIREMKRLLGSLNYDKHAFYMQARNSEGKRIFQRIMKKAIEEIVMANLASNGAQKTLYMIVLSIKNTSVARSFLPH